MIWAIPAAMLAIYWFGRPLGRKYQLNTCRRRHEINDDCKFWAAIAAWLWPYWIPVSGLVRLVLR